MEFDPIIYLKQAVIEKNDQERLNLISKSCRMITEFLPFDEKNIVIFEHISITRYLFLLNPFLQASSFIIDGIFEKFVQNEIQILQVLKEILFVCEIKEYSPKQYQFEQNQINQNNNQNSFEMNSSQDFKEDKHFFTAPYSIELMLYMDKIKKNLGQYINQMIDLLISQRLKGELKLKTEIEQIILEIVFRYLYYTNSEENILTGSMILQKLQNEWKGIIESDYEWQINELLQSKIKIKSHHIILSNISSPEKQFNSDNDDDSSSTNSNEQNSNFKSLLRSIDEWLLNDDVPKLGKKEFILEFFKKHDNYEIILEYLLEPYKHKVSQSYSEFMKIRMINRNFARELLSHKQFIKIDIHDLPKNFNQMIVRSHRVMTMISQQTNLDILQKMDKTYIELFFTKLSNLITSDNFIANMNHIAQVIQSIMQFQIQQGLHLLVKENLIIKILAFIDFSQVQNFLFFLKN